MQQGSTRPSELKERYSSIMLRDIRSMARAAFAAQAASFQRAFGTSAL
jgi:hypothetical protein